MHAPNLRRLRRLFDVRVVCSHRGHEAAALADSLSAPMARTDPDQILARDDLDAVLIGTRHDTHAELVLAALQAGKHVFVEKPLCLSPQELARLCAARAQGLPGSPVLMVGHNAVHRRRAPAARAVRGGRRGGPPPVTHERAASRPGALVGRP